MWPSLVGDGVKINRQAPEYPSFDNTPRSTETDNGPDVMRLLDLEHGGRKETPARNPGRPSDSNGQAHH